MYTIAYAFTHTPLSKEGGSLQGYSESYPPAPWHPNGIQWASDKGGDTTRVAQGDGQNPFGAAIVRFREIWELRASSAAAQNRARIGPEEGGGDTTRGDTTWNTRVIETHRNRGTFPSGVP